jgi:uncharacterized protein (TIGR04255 family)
MHERLARAPIVEALVEFRVERGEGPLEAALARLKDDLTDSYAVWHHQFDIRGTVHVSEHGVASTHKKTPQGWLGWSASRDRCVTLALDRFAFSRLHPYSSWEELRDEARGLWERYRDAMRPVRVRRIGVRYINRILVPQGAMLEDYFLTFPKVSDRLPQAVTDVAMRLVLPRPEDGATVILQQVQEQRPDSDPIVAIILDVDAGAGGGCPADAESPWLIAENLRRIKNETFFGSMTEIALEMFR